jgi:hypothetical protein
MVCGKVRAMLKAVSHDFLICMLEALLGPHRGSEATVNEVRDRRRRDRPSELPASNLLPVSIDILVRPDFPAFGRAGQVVVRTHGADFVSAIVV